MDTTAYGVKANVRAPHRFLRFGSLCWLHIPNPGWANERFVVWGISRGGRRVVTYVDARDLTNYRAGWIANEPQFPSSKQFPFETRELAQAWADAVSKAYGDQPVRPHAARFGRLGGE